MAVAIKLGEPNPNEVGALKTLVSILPGEWALLTNIPQRIIGRETDCCLVGPRGVILIELKRWGGTITARRMGAWDGVRDTDKNPLDQAAEACTALKSYFRKVDLPRVYVSSLVLLTAPDCVLKLGHPDLEGQVGVLREAPILVDKHLAWVSNTVRASTLLAFETLVRVIGAFDQEVPVDLAASWRAFEQSKGGAKSERDSGSEPNQKNTFQKPTCELRASSTSIFRGDKVRLTWTTTNADRFSIEPTVGPLVLPLQGFVWIEPTGTTTYVGTAHGKGGTAICNTKITFEDRISHRPLRSSVLAFCAIFVLIALVWAAQGVVEVPPPPSPKPSFDCTTAHSWSEHAICANSALADADTSMANEYATRIKMLTRRADRRSLRDDQRIWLKSREQCQAAPEPTTCLANAFRDRIAALRTLNSASDSAALNTGTPNPSGLSCSPYCYIARDGQITSSMPTYPYPVSFSCKADWRVGEQQLCDATPLPDVSAAPAPSPAPPADTTQTQASADTSSDTAPQSSAQPSPTGPILSFILHLGGRPDRHHR